MLYLPYSSCSLPPQLLLFGFQNKQLSSSWWFLGEANKNATKMTHVCGGLDIQHIKSTSLLLENNMLFSIFSSKSRKVSAMFGVAEDLQEFIIQWPAACYHGVLFSETAKKPIDCTACAGTSFGLRERGYINPKDFLGVFFATLALRWYKKRRCRLECLVWESRGIKLMPLWFDVRKWSSGWRCVDLICNDVCLPRFCRF